MYLTNYYIENRRTANRIVLFLFVVVLFYGLIVGPYKKNRFYKYGKYTIGYIIELKYTRDGYDPVYKYYVKGQEYVDNEARIIQGVHRFNKSFIGKRFFVLFDSCNPARVCLLPLNPVPENISTVPELGWNEMPSN